MATISSPGVGSGINVADLVSQLVAAEGQPVSNRLDKKEAQYQARISALGSLKGALSDFQSKLSGLSLLSTFKKRSASVTNPDAFSATVVSTASEGQYNLSVTKLAKSQTLVTDTLNPFASTTDAVGTGTLTIRYGTGPIGSFVQNTNKGTFNITIDSTNNSLAGIRDAINEADAGVRASIINNGSGYLLSLTSEDTGAANSLEITVSDAGDGNDTDALGLSRLAYNAAASNLTETAAAQDASVDINGITITSANNTITDAINGVTLNLLAVQSGTLTISHDKDNVTKSIDDFINSYNSLMNTIGGLTSYDPETQKAGILNGDAGARNIVNQLRRMTTTVISGLSGPFSTLAELGITTQDDGTLGVDNTKLQGALDNNFDDVAGLFSVLGRPSDALINYITSSADTKAGDYSVTVSALASQGYINGATTSALADDGAGNFSTAFVIDANNDTFSVNVNGISSGSITLTQKSYTTTSELAAEIQTRINSDSALSGLGFSVTVTFDAANDRFTITSDRYGSDSDITFSAVDTNTLADLGFGTALTSTAGTDIQGSIGGLTATGDGRYLIGNGDADGLKVEVLGGSTGSRGSISFTRGIADQIKDYADTLLNGDVLDSRIKSVQANIDDIQDQRDSLELRLNSLEARLTARFSALDTLVSQLTTTSNFLANQLSSLNALAANKLTGQ